MHLVRHREVVAALAQVPPAMPSEFAPDVDTAHRIVAAALADDRSWLDPIEVKRLFDAYDIPVVPTFAAADAEEAVAHANTIFAQGSTVVLKIMSRDIVHKSDVGGVVLNLTSADAVRRATADILARARSLRPEARIAGVMVQAMVVRAKARELILGLADDPTFGTVVVFGRGGTAVEIINDKALALPPLDLQLARSLIERTRVSRLLRAYRDVPAVKIALAAMAPALGRPVVVEPHTITPVVALHDVGVGSTEAQSTVINGSIVSTTRTLRAFCRPWLSTASV
jgi:acetyltransferase